MITWSELNCVSLRGPPVSQYSRFIFMGITTGQFRMMGGGGCIFEGDGFGKSLLMGERHLCTSPYSWSPNPNHTLPYALCGVVRVQRSVRLFRVSMFSSVSRCWVPAVIPSNRQQGTFSPPTNYQAGSTVPPLWTEAHVTV